MLIFMSYCGVKNEHTQGIFLCDCGNLKITQIGKALKGETKSCGCLNHGFSNHTLYTKLQTIIKRCYKPSHIGYENYGGRGIYVCDEWLRNYVGFIEWCYKNGWKPELQIDRIDNNGPYSPDNCRFVTRSENVRNSRTARLTLEQVLEIRKKLKGKKNGRGTRKIAKEYGVSDRCIYDIRIGRTWR